jgi:hypothetical protein
MYYLLFYRTNYILQANKELALERGHNQELAKLLKRQLQTLNRKVASEGMSAKTAIAEGSFDANANTDTVPPVSSLLSVVASPPPSASMSLSPSSLGSEMDIAQQQEEQEEEQPEEPQEEQTSATNVTGAVPVVSSLPPVASPPPSLSIAAPAASNAPGGGASGITVAITSNVSQALRSRTPGAVKTAASLITTTVVPEVISNKKAKAQSIRGKSGKRTRTTKRSSAVIVPRVRKEAKQQLHDPEITPDDNTQAENEDIAESMSDHSFIYMENVEHRLKVRPGAKKVDCFKANKRATWMLEDFLDNEERVYIHLNLLRAADSISASCDIVDPDTGEDGWTVLENNAGNNDGLRKAANHCLESDEKVYDIVMNFVYLVREEECIGAGAYACGGNGKEFSITLLIALIGAQRQRDHTDYDPDLFEVYEDFSVVDDVFRDSCAEFNGASMFINFSWNNDHKLDLNETCNKTGKYRFITLPAMSIVIISGDLVHAGSANCSGAVTRKFFLYLDPHPHCRNLGTFLVNGEYINDNFIWFGSYNKHV